jgi:TadE-like protein
MTGMRKGRAQALVETAMVVPLLVLLALGTVGVGRIVHARMGLSAAAREAARAATLAPLGASDKAERAGKERGEQVARGYGLRSAVISVDATPFERGSMVEATASYVVNERDLPLLGWQTIKLETSHLEQVDRYRSRGQ